MSASFSQLSVYAVYLSVLLCCTLISCGDDNTNSASGGNASTQSFLTLNLKDGRTISLREEGTILDPNFNGVLRFSSGGGCSDRFPCNQEKTLGLLQGRRDGAPEPEIKRLGVRFSTRFENKTNNPLETMKIFIEEGPLGVFDRFEEAAETMSTARPSITGIDWVTGENVQWSLEHSSVESAEFGALTGSLLENTDTVDGVLEESWFIRGSFGACTLISSNDERIEVESGDFNLWLVIKNEW